MDVYKADYNCPKCGNNKLKVLYDKEKDILDVTCSCGSTQQMLPLDRTPIQP